MKQYHPIWSKLQPWLSQLGLYAVTLWAMLTIIFFLPRAMPGDPLQELVDPNSTEYAFSDDIRAQLASYYGLDKPLWQQYTSYLANLARGDFGWSISLNAPVSQLIGEHLPWTLLLMIPSICIATLISLWVGTQSGWMRNSPVDRSLLVSFLTLNTLPAFLIGALLLLLFGARLDWLPLSGARTAFKLYQNLGELAGDVVVHMILPLVTLTLSMAGRDYLLMRNSIISVLGEDFMLVARGKGLTERDLKYKHAMRNALLPVFTRFTMQMGAAITGAVLIETLFAYPGMGRLMFNSVAARDYPVLEACFILCGVAMLLANLVADLNYAWLDPRTRRKA